jgi:nicotinate-nucleotide pyrophosphorylase
MRQQGPKPATPSHANDNREEFRTLLEQSGDVAPVDIQTYAKRAADIISHAAVKARERLGRKAQR